MLTEIKNSFERFSGRNAFFIADEYFSYERLQHLVRNIHYEIRQNCTADEIFIGVVANNDLYTYASILAIWFSGKGYVPIHPGIPAERNRSMIQKAGITTLLSSNQDIALDLLCASVKLTNTSELKEAKSIAPDVIPDEQSYAYLMFTSGSTGEPKGVPISFGNLNTFKDAFNEAGFLISENDRFLQMFDLAFDLSVMSFLIPLCYGACIFTLPNEGMKHLNIYSLLQEKKITVALMVPSVIEFLKPYFSEISLPEMRYSIFCGEALHNDTLEKWKDCVPNAEIHNLYGPTEATIFCLDYKINPEPDIREFNGIVCIGKPMKNSDASIRDENGQIKEDFQKGELCLFGNQVMKGYWNDPALTKTSFFQNDSDPLQKYLYRTGDVAFKDTEGNFYFCGRTDEQLKIQGHRVELTEIEFVARNFLNGRNVVAMPVQNKMRISQIFLFVENYPQEFTALNDYLKTQLPDFMLPEEIFNCDVFPLNPNGKVDRDSLKNQFLQF